MICRELHSALEAITARYEKDQIVVVADRAVIGYGLPVMGNYPCLAVEVSEARKSLETIELIWDFFFAQGLTRRGLVIAVGGGVLTDMTGFAAATYKRGVDYVNIPTTLLAMIDASSGGKTGINYHGLKNSIGVFGPPVETLIWPDWLKTLSSQQFLSGFGEMLKTGLINDAAKLPNDEPQAPNAAAKAACFKQSLREDERLWDALLQYDLETMPIETLTPLIDACVAVKEQIVAADPREEGLRKALNLGHTFGHALEEVTGDGLSVTGGMPHGYAVVYGLIAELYLSVTKLGCPKAPLQQLTQLMLHYYGKPQCKCSDRERLIDLMRQDKKMSMQGKSTAHSFILSVRPSSTRSSRPMRQTKPLITYSRCKPLRSS